MNSGGECGAPRGEGGAEGTVSGVTGEAFQPVDLAVAQISAPARAPRPLFSRPSGTHASVRSSTRATLPPSSFSTLARAGQPAGGRGGNPPAVRARQDVRGEWGPRPGRSPAPPRRSKASLPPRPPGPVSSRRKASRKSSVGRARRRRRPGGGVRPLPVERAARPRRAPRRPSPPRRHPQRARPRGCALPPVEKISSGRRGAGSRGRGGPAPAAPRRAGGRARQRGPEEFQVGNSNLETR